MDKKRNPRKDVNVFGQLRRLAVRLTEEPPRLQNLLDNPPEFDEDAARLILKETLRDTKKLNEEARANFTQMEQEASEFETLLDACQRLVLKQEEKVRKIKTHFKKYGYKPKDEKVVDDPVENDDKENQPVSDNEENSPQSPGNDMFDKMPSPSDFGISKSTLNFLKNIQRQERTDQTTKVFRHNMMSEMGKNPESMSDDVPLAFCHDGLLVTPGMGLPMGGSPSDDNHDSFASPTPPVFLTPCMQKLFSQKSNHPSMDETYVVKSMTDLTEPEPPVFLTPGLTVQGWKRDIKSVDIPKMGSMNTADEPEVPQEPKLEIDDSDDLAFPDTPELTFRSFIKPKSLIQEPVPKMRELPIKDADFESHPLPASPEVKSTALDDLEMPDTPEITCTFKYTKNIGTMPTSKSQQELKKKLTAKPELPKPVTPDAVFRNPTPPVSLIKQSDDFSLPTPPTFLSEVAKKTFCTAEHTDLKPNNPSPQSKFSTREGHKSLVTGLASDEQLENVHKNMSDPQLELQGMDRSTSSLSSSQAKRIPLITKEEYEKQPDYLKNIVTLDKINQCVNKVNTFIKEKYEAGYGDTISASELCNDLGFGSHAKKFIVLLMQVKRITQKKMGEYSVVVSQN